MKKTSVSEPGQGNLPDLSASPGQPDYEVLGFTLVGPPPLGVVHIPWGPGLYVLYGRDGAGGSSILKGIQAALGGVALPGARVFVHLRLREVNQPTSWEDGLANDIHRSLFNELWSFWCGTFDEGEYFDNRLYDLQRIHDIATLVSEYLRIEARQSHLDAEIGQEGLFSLLATGDEDDPHWDLYIAGYPTEDHPGLQKYLEEHRWVAWGLHLQWRKGVSEPFDNRTGAALRHRPFGAFQIGATPAWVPVPTVAVSQQFRTACLPGLIDIGSMSRPPEQLAAMTAQVVGPDGVLFEDHNGSLRPDPMTVDALSKIAWEAHFEALGLMDDAPLFMARFTDPASWASNRQIVWEASNPPSGTASPLEDLSDAERWLAEIAIRLVLQRHQDPTLRCRVLLLDEPEEALPAHTLPHFVTWLAERAARFNGPVYVATNAAQFLKPAGATLIRVRRGDSRTATLFPLRLVKGEPLAEMAERRVPSSV